MKLLLMILKLICHYRERERESRERTCTPTCACYKREESIFLFFRSFTESFDIYIVVIYHSLFTFLEFHLTLAKASIFNKCSVTRVSCQFCVSERLSRKCVSRLNLEFREDVYRIMSTIKVNIFYHICLVLYNIRTCC